MKTYLNIFVFWAISICCSHAQDAQFSQFFATPLLRNPALAGIFAGKVRVQAVYRNQSGGGVIAYRTGSLSVEYKQPVGKENDYITIGGEMLYDRAGVTNFTTSNILPVINYHKALSSDKSKYLSLAFMGGYVQRNIDETKITTNNQYSGYGYNPALANGEPLTQYNYHYWDGDVGLTFNSSMAGNADNSYYVGIAYYHFNRPKNSFYVNPPVELNPRLVFSAGFKFNVGDVSYCTVEGDVSNQGSFTDVIGGITYSYKIGDDNDNPDYIVNFGGYIRWNNAFIPFVKINYNPFALGFSYDANISQQKSLYQSRTGIEVSISYTPFVSRDNIGNGSSLSPRF